MNQVNPEHNQLTTEWMPEVQAGRMSIQDAMNNPDGKKLTSFIGMGRLPLRERVGSLHTF